MHVANFALDSTPSMNAVAVVCPLVLAPKFLAAYGTDSVGVDALQVLVQVVLRLEDHGANFAGKHLTVLDAGVSRLLF